MIKPDRELLYTLRSYQEEILSLFDGERAQNSHNLHIVAPPGAGKTIMGIGIMLKSGRKTVVFSPNAAIQMQWVDKFYEATDVLNGGLVNTTSCSTQIDEKPTYLSLTYQSITVKDEEGLHPNAQKLIDTIVAEEYTMIICDECHHLTGYWAEVITLLKERMKTPFLIGFTATPPIESDASGMELYCSLLGEVDYTIPQAQLVKSNNLAPFQDLIYLTTPSDEETSHFQKAQEQLQNILDEVEKNTHHRALSEWVHDSLEKCRFKGKIRTYAKIFRSDIDQPIAFARYLISKKITLPIEVPELDEMQVPPSSDDYALVLGDFLVDQLLEKKDEPTLDLIDRIIAAFSRIGFRFTGKSFRPTNSGVVQSLTLSKSKLTGLQQIVEKELDAMEERIRLLVLVDYEFGKKQQDGINAVDVMDRLTSQERCDEIDPIMLTGRSVLVDDDILPLFLSQTEAFRDREGLSFSLKHWPEAGYIRIEGEGAHWNSRTYIRLITFLFDTGLTRCLISTRSLLGEGWDSVRCNTLIDMTAIAGYISVNQMRGRTLRLDSRDPLKCANNWDIVTLMPGVHFGMHDFHRLKRKFGHFFGISDDGVIEKGLGHVHPLFSEANEGDISLNIDVINRDMFNRAGHRHECYTLWENHKGEHNSEMESLDLKVEEKPTIERTRSRAEYLQWIQMGLRQKRSQQLKRAIPLTIIGAGLGLFFPPLLLGLPMYVGIEIARALKNKKALLSQEEPQEQFSSFLRQLALVVLRSMKSCELIDEATDEEWITIHDRSDECYRIVLENVTPQVSDRFTNAVWELLGPVQNHRYILASKRYSGDKKSQLRSYLKNPEAMATEVTAYYPLPLIFGKKRSMAQIFEKEWHEAIGLGTLYYTRSDDGAAVLQSCLRKKPLTLRREKKTIWN